MSDLEEHNTVQATFPTRPQAEEAVTRLQHHGVERAAIQMRDRSGHQYPGAGRTGDADEDVAEHLVQKGAKGGVIGSIIGALVGAVIGFVIFEPLTVAWWTMVLGGVIFGGGIAVLLGLMTGFSPRGASGHGGTVARDEDVEVIVVVDITEPGDTEPVREILRATGGT